MPDSLGAGGTLFLLLPPTLLPSGLSSSPSQKPPNFYDPMAVSDFSVLSKQFLCAPFCHSPSDPTVLRRQQHPHAQLIWSNSLKPETARKLPEPAQPCRGEKNTGLLVLSPRLPVCECHPFIHLFIHLVNKNLLSMC